MSSKSIPIPEDHLPGSSKAQSSRLTWYQDTRIPVCYLTTINQDTRTPVCYLNTINQDTRTPVCYLTTINQDTSLLPHQHQPGYHDTSLLPHHHLTRIPEYCLISHLPGYHRIWLIVVTTMTTPCVPRVLATILGQDRTLHEEPCQSGTDTSHVT